jgi:hypothetical protein
VSRKHRTDIGKQDIQLRNLLPAEVSGTLSCKVSNFRKMVRKVINEVTRSGANHQNSEVK